jgi:two-component system, cell cycle sensor histidine kinase and response regulator CckA
MTQQSFFPPADTTKLADPTAARTILLVEDDAFVRQWVHIQLEKSGYNLLEASDGADALLIAEMHQGNIDLIVTDVVMPRVSGPELVERLLRLRPSVQVVYMSGYPEPFLRSSTTFPPGIIYLQKPFAMTTLLTMMTELLERHDAKCGSWRDDSC